MRHGLNAWRWQVCLAALGVILSSDRGPFLAAASSTPYLGTPAAIPGQIEAENFDSGGEGIAYHDNSAGNAGGQYRGGDVDIEASSEGGYDVGWTSSGEWLNYTANVAAAGSYVVQLRVASPGGASMHVGFNTASNVWQTVSIPATGRWLNYTVNVASAGSYAVQLRVASPGGAAMHVGFNAASNVWMPVSIPATGGWQNWTTVSVTVTLGAGVQQMTLRADSSGYNIN